MRTVQTRGWNSENVAGTAVGTDWVCQQEWALGQENTEAPGESVKTRKSKKYVLAFLKNRTQRQAAGEVPTCPECPISLGRR